jgi:Subtilase family
MRRIALAVLLVLGLVPGAAFAAFPGSNPDESVRLNTPNDPGYDPCEPDNEGGATCSSVFSEDYERFGFAPSSTQNTATYKNPAQTPRQQLQNTLAGRTPLGQIPGVSADRAWKRSIGRPDVRIGIFDTGIRWGEDSLRTKVALNAGELPTPQCGRDDCNRDGAFNVDDFANDSRVSKTAGRDEADDILDASDLLAAFSDGTDADHNGYPDDIAGWDFFDNDNDPYDASSYASAENHGTGRAQEAGQLTNEGAGATSLCPRCQIVPLRVWDTFVVDTNNFGLASLYAADNRIEVVESALGGLTNTRFARAAMRDAYRRGVFFAVVSSDLNTADHNWPTTYDEAMMVQGTVADQQGLGSSDAEVGGFLGDLGIATDAPIGTWFRNSGTTQYGGHAHIAMPAVTGSQATGQAAGAAGLIVSYGRQRGYQLAPNEVKQLFTGTAEDVVAENTVGSGVPDPAQPGWDQHFGYGRPDLGLALERIGQGKIPPHALITSPDWFTPFRVGHDHTVSVGGRVSARTGPLTYQLEWAPGAEPAESEFRPAGSRHASAGPVDGSLGMIDLATVRAALDARPGGGAANDPTAPQTGPGDQDPNEPAFTVRIRVTDAHGNKGEDRKVLFAYRDETLLPGWVRRLGTGGEASERLWDVDGDNRLDVVLADSSGALHVLDRRGDPLASFNGGKPVETRVVANVRPGAPGFGRVAPPRESLRTPAIGDIDGDLEPEIVDSAGEHVYAWNMDGSVVPGFPVRVNPGFSRPQDRTRSNHVKRGFIASPVLADLQGDGALEIVIGALDQHVYAWDGRGRTLPGFPVKLRDPTLPGAEIITTPAVGDITGDSRPEIVTPTAEFDPNPSAPGAPSGPTDLPGLLQGGLINILANAIGGSGRTYALDAHGHVLPGWPIKPNGAVPDALPLVAPSYDHVLGNLDGDPKLEIIGGVVSGDVQAYEADGSARTTFDSSPGGGEAVDKSKVLNLFENPIVADLDGQPGLEVMRGGLTLNGLVNLGIAVGQNLPYNHVVQAWNGATGQSLPAYPQAVEDYQLLSSPAVADVSDAPGRELLVGTGLYLLRDINANGQEGTGFPKFTGGWIFAVPAIGDIDGDNKLDIATLTREGNAFAWKTGSPVCGTNDQWWTSRHDERSTGAYGTDTRPPAVPAALALEPGASDTRLRWTVPGDDWQCGKPSRLRILTSDAPITGAAAGSVLVDAPAEGSAGAAAVRDLPTASLKGELAVVYRDDAGNWGRPARISRGGAPLGPAPVAPPVARDSTAPTLRVSAPRYGPSSGRVRVRWRGRDASPVRYRVQVRRGVKRYRTLRAATAAASLRYRAPRGTTLTFRVVATDAAGNRSRPRGARTLVPLDQTSRRLRLDGGWRRAVRRHGAFGGSVAIAGRAGARGSLRFRGTGVAVFLARGSRVRTLRVVLDGRRRTVRRGRAGLRRPAFARIGLRRGRTHRLVLVAPRRGVRLDAVAVSR